MFNDLDINFIIESSNKKSSYSNKPPKKMSLFNFGMDYKDLVKKMSAIPLQKELIDNEDKIAQSMFALDTGGWNKNLQYKAFNEKNLSNTRDNLRKYALQPELEDILDVMTNECVVYDSKHTYFIDPQLDEAELARYDNSKRAKINEKMIESFTKIYNLLGFKYDAWDIFKKFLIDGILAYEILWDDLKKPKNIIAIVELDPLTLTKKYQDNKWVWIQYQGITSQERILDDHQVIYINFSENNSSERLSYLERLIRPFNIYRIIEQAQLVWTITNASYKMKFTIPVSGMSKSAGSQTLRSAMNKYQENISFDSNSGELRVNGSTNLPFNKEYWLPEHEGGKPEIEVIGNDGPELNDNDQLKYFKNQLYRISKIPPSRFDIENTDGWPGTDSSSYMRAEIDFGRYVMRLRNIFSEIIVKPMKLQMMVNTKEMKLDYSLFESIRVNWKSNNIFDSLMEMDLMTRRTEFIRDVKESMVDMDVEGNEIKFFSSKFLVKKFLGLTEQELKLNSKYKMEEINELNLAGQQKPDKDSIF